MAFDAGDIQATLTLDRRPFQRELDLARREAIAFARQSYEITLTAQTRGVTSQLAAVAAQAQSLGQMNPSINVGVTGTAGAVSSLASVGAAASSVGAMDPTVDVGVRGAASSVAQLGTVAAASTAAGMASTNASGGMSMMSGGLVLIAAVAALAAPAIGLVSAAIAALPIVIAAAVAGFGAIMLGLDGIKAAAEPLIPLFNEMRAAVSTAFAQGLGPAMANIAAIMPIVSAGMVGTAQALSQIATQVTAVLSSAEGMAALQATFGAINQFLTAIAPFMADFVQNFLILSSVGGAFLQPLATALNSAADGFQRMINAAIQTGVLQQSLAGLAETFNVLFQFLNQLIGAGLQAWAVLAGPFNTALAALGNLIVALMPMLTAFTGLLLAVLIPAINILIPIVTALTPPFIMLANILGTVLGGVLGALVPLITAVANVLGMVLTQALSAIMPILPVLVGAFTGIVSAVLPLVPLIGQLASALIGALAPVLPMIIGAFGQVVTAITPLIGALVQIVGALIPPLIALVQMLAPVIAGLAMAFGQVIAAVLPLVPVLIQIVQALLPPLLGIIMALLPVVGVLAGAFLQVVNALLPLLPPLVQLVMMLLPLLLAVLNPILAVLPPIASVIATVLTVAIQILVTVITTVIGWITQLVGWLSGLGGAFSTVWNGIVAVVNWAWNTVLRPVLDAIGLGLRFLGAIIGTVLLTPFILAWNMIAAIVTWAWNTVLKPIWDAMVALWQNVLAPTLTWLYNSVFLPIWTAISTVIRWAWEQVISPVLTLLVNFWRFTLAVALTWLYNSVFLPMWNAIGAIVRFTWEQVIKPALDLLVSFWRNILAPALSWLYNSIFLPLWNALGAIIRFVWENVINPAFQALVTGLNWLGDNFDRVVAWIRDIWNRMRGYLAQPVNFVIETVWNNGIRKAWNLVAGLVGLGEIGPMAKIPEFARGGPVIGAGTATSDSIPAMLSNQEHVWTAAEVAGAGGHGAVAQLRSAAASGMLRGDLAYFANGGPVLGFADGGAWRGMWDTVRKQFPTARLTSAYRPGDSGYHGSGQAVDVAGPRSMDMPFMLNVNRWLAGTFPNSTQLIHTPGINLLNGQPHTYNASTRAQHYNHVHWAMAGGAGEGGGGFLGGLFNFVRDRIADAFNAITNPAIDALRRMVGPPPPAWREAIPAFATKARDTLRDFMLGLADSQGGMTGIPGSGPVFDQVKAVADRYGWGAGPEWDALARLIQKESSWDPNAQNPTSTAFGLFQFLNSTWGSVGAAKTANPGLQAEAGLRYIQQRYGSPSRALAFHNANNWYDAGGALPPGLSTIFNGTGNTETVVPLPPNLVDNLLSVGSNRGVSVTLESKLDDLIDVLMSGGGGVHIGSVSTTDTASELAEELAFRMRSIRRGGVHSG